MRDCRLAIFDLDGTLLNTIDDLADSCNHALSVHGFPLHSTQEYCLFVGNGVQELIRRALPEDRRDSKTLRQVEKTYQARYQEHAQDKTRPYDGVVRMLGELKRGGIHTAVLTNKPHVHVPGLMRQYFPALIDFALGQREGVPHKPDPTAAVEILEHFSCPARHCAYIGDTDVDMQTGRNAGFFTVGAAWGFRTKEELESHGAHVIIDKPMQLVPLLVDISG